MRLTALRTLGQKLLGKIVKGTTEMVPTRRKRPDGGVADKIPSIARYWIATGEQTLPRMAAWQAMHDAPYPGTMSDDVIGDLFQTVGIDEGGIQEFFRLRAAHLGTAPVVAYDSTTISTYSEDLHEARQGFNKDGDGLDTIKLLTLYSETSVLQNQSNASCGSSATHPEWADQIAAFHDSNRESPCPQP